MAAATLADVTLELEIANENLGIMRANSNLAVEYLDMFHDMVEEKFENLIIAVTGDALAKLEATREQQIFNEKMLDALHDLKPKDKGGDAKPEEGFGIAGWGLMLAGTLGTIVGGLKGWYKGWKAFSLKSITTMEKMGSRILKASMKTNKYLGYITRSFRLGYIFLKTFVIELGKALKGLGKDFFSLVKSGFKSLGTSISKMFSSLGKSKAGQLVLKGINMFRGWMNSLYRFFRPTIYIFKKMTGTVGKMSKMTASISKYFAGFSKAFGFFGKLASKIAWPITVIIATVQGAIAAWNKEGGFISKLGAFFGGLVGNLVGGIMDLGKSLISWVLGKLGFKDAEKWLDSFSFEELINDLIQGIFDTVDGVIDWFAETFSWENLKKQWTDLKDWAGGLGDALFGWWDDFQTWMDETFSWENIYMSLPVSVRKGLKWAGLAPDMSEGGSGSESNMNDTSNTGMSSPAPNVPQSGWETIKGWFNSDDAQPIPNQTGAQLDAAQDANANMKSKSAPVIINAPSTTNNVSNSSSTGSVNVRSGGAKKAAPGPSYESMMTAP